MGRRPALLARTLASLANFGGVRFVAVNDFGDAESNQVLLAHIPQATIVAHSSRQGHHAAVDAMYRTVETKYILHLEDDWEFSGGRIAPSKQASLQQRRARIVCPRRASRGEPRPQFIVPMREPEELTKRHAGLDGLQRAAGRHRAQAIGSLIDAPEPLVHEPTQQRNLRIRRSERIEPFECFIGFGDPAQVQLRARHAQPCLQHARVLRSERLGHRQRVKRSPLSEQALDRGDW